MMIMMMMIMVMMIMMMTIMMMLMIMWHLFSAFPYANALYSTMRGLGPDCIKQFTKKEVWIKNARFG